MCAQPNFLTQVRRYLLSRGEEFQWVTMGNEGEKIGLAYLPIDATGLPCTFMFTELHEPCSLVFDAHFGARVAPEDIPEVAQLLLTLNANLPEGQLLIDRRGGFVYYRLKYVPDDMNISEDEICTRIRRMEELGVSMCLTYSDIIAREFPSV